MNLFDNWFEQLINQTSSKWVKDVEVKGLCKRISGPKAFYAEVSLSFSPSNSFEIKNLLDSSIAKRAIEENWINSIIYGAIDVFLVYPPRPIKNFRLTIHEIKYNEIDSVPFAFRLASRDAAIKALKIHFPKMDLVN